MSKLTNVINHSIEMFTKSLGFKKGYFSQYLNYSENQYPKYINPNDVTHNMKLSDLDLILDNLDDKHTKIILDYLCMRNNFQCITNADDDNSKFNVSDSLHNINSKVGSLNTEYLDSKEDGILDNVELNNFITKSYNIRQTLICFENQVKAILNA